MLQLTRDRDRELVGLAAEVAEMGGLAEHLVMDSVIALTRIDAARARSVIEADQKLDAILGNMVSKSLFGGTIHDPT